MTRNNTASEVINYLWLNFGELKVLIHFHACYHGLLFMTIPGLILRTDECSWLSQFDFLTWSLPELSPVLAWISHWFASKLLKSQLLWYEYNISVLKEDCIHALIFIKTFICQHNYFMFKVGKLVLFRLIFICNIK